MYRGKNNYSLDSSCLTNSISPTHMQITQGENLQREVQNYTRKLEMEKRRFFRLQENHREVLKEHTDKTTQLDTLKSKKFITEISKLNGKKTTLQNTLDKAIASYNQALSKNNSLKNQIDQLRKDRKNNIQGYKSIQHKLDKLRRQIEQRKKQIQTKGVNIQQVKGEIIKIKLHNEKEAQQYNQQMIKMQKSFKQEKLAASKQNQHTQNQNVDSHPLVKLRLKNLLFSNKQKIRVIQSYKKNMHVIQTAFEEMIGESGITNLEELTRAILKQQQQQLFVYSYIDKLNRQMECLKEKNQQIKKNIEKQNQINEQHRMILSGTPESQKRKQQEQNFINQKEKSIKELQNFLGSIQQTIQNICLKLNVEFDPLNQQNTQYFLSIIEQQLIKNYENKDLNTNNFAQDVTKYSKCPPSIINDELKDKIDDKIYDSQKLRQYALEYWQKRRNQKNKLNEDAN